MTREIILLTDYQGRFGSKHFDHPYRSGMDKTLLEKYFSEQGFKVKFVNFSYINFRNSVYKNKYILYTSSEDDGDFYKSYIEDIVYGLELSGARVIPSFKFLRSTNNKIFMEILRDQQNSDKVKNLRSYHFGTLEDMKHREFNFVKKKVVKPAIGACSKGVQLAGSPLELENCAKLISRTRNLKKEIRDYGRSLKHKGYKRESKYRRKYIIQEFIPGLSEDWKILIYGSRYYVLNRKTRKNDFRASGSGNFSFDYNLPEGLLNYSKSVFESFRVPNLSIDVAYDGENFYLLEFQAVFFGTTTLVISPHYFEMINGAWEKYKETSELEKVYVESIISYLDENTK